MPNVDLSESYQVREILALHCSNFRLKQYEITKIVKEIMFEGVWDELKSKKGFQGQLFTRHLRPTQVFM